MSKKVHCALMGASGRMGQEIINLAEEMPNLDITCGVASGDDRYLDEVSKLDPAKVDVVIDFSSPELFLTVLDWSVQAGKPFVSGTTGINESQVEALDRAAQKIPVLWAPNMSLGITLMAELMEQFRSVAEEFDFQLEELHHVRKKDAPSGTAIALQSRLESVIGRKAPPAISIRGGGIFGIHKFWAMSAEETMIIEHTALNRSVFARGALRAALWLSGQRSGRFEMRNVLGR